MNILKVHPMVIKTDEEFKNKSNSLKVLSNHLDKLTSNNNFIYFNIPGLSSKFEYHGIKLIYCDNCNEFIMKLLNNFSSYSNVYINDYQIRNKDIFYLNHFSKVTDFLNNRKNGLLHDYLKNKDIYHKDLEFQNYLAKIFFEFKDKNLESLINLDMEDASLLSFFSIIDQYVNSNNIELIFNIIANSANDKKLIIINDYNILDIENVVEKYLDKFNFIIVTNKLEKWINDNRFLELIVVINESIKNLYNLDSLEILDKKMMIRFLEKIKKEEKDKINKYIQLLEIC